MTQLLIPPTRAECHEALWRAYLPFVQTVTRKYGRMWMSIDPSIGPDDVLQDAYLIFHYAVSKYDSTRHVPFPAFLSMALSRTFLRRYRDAKFPPAVTRVFSDWAVPTIPDPRRDEELIEWTVMLDTLAKRLPMLERRLLRRMVNPTPSMIRAARGSIHWNRIVASASAAGRSTGWSRNKSLALWGKIKRRASALMPHDPKLHIRIRKRIAIRRKPRGIGPGWL